MLLEDLFDVKNIDEDGKKFDNISRISALSQTYNLELTLDVNTEIYPIKVRQARRALLLAVILRARMHAPACACMRGIRYRRVYPSLAFSAAGLRLLGGV